MPTANKVRSRTNPPLMLHYNHPVFDPAVQLCFEFIQHRLDTTGKTDYHLRRSSIPSFSAAPKNHGRTKDIESRTGTAFC